MLTRRQIKASELFKLAKKERNWRLKRRIKGVAMVAAGKLSREIIARRLKTDSDQVREWIRRYNESGLAGLKDKPGRGNKPTMTARQQKALGQALERSPREAAVNSNIWTGRAAQEYLARKGWFKGSLGGVYAIIHRLGFTLQRPNRQSLEADPKAAKRFLSQLAGGGKGGILKQCSWRKTKPASFPSQPPRACGPKVAQSF